jgi:hypothetical protein
MLTFRTLKLVVQESDHLPLLDLNDLVVGVHTKERASKMGI